MVERIKDVGEFGLIRRIRELLDREGVSTPGVTLGIGDDTAAFLPRPGCEILITCDSLVEGRHFLPDWITFEALGRRAMVQNISDIGAMGGRPLYALVSLGLKEDLPLEKIDDLYRGFLKELNPFQASIIGGNLTRCGAELFIDITLIGEAEQGKTLKRGGARKGDALLVSGCPGRAAAGLDLLLHRPDDPRLKDHPLVSAYQTPTHRARLGEKVARAGWATAMIDISDGFLGDLGHILSESRVGARLFPERFPIPQELKEAAEELGRNPLAFFLGPSDDYELIITCPPKNAEKILDLGKALDPPVSLTVVGAINDRPEVITLAAGDGTETPVSLGGWDHFLEKTRRRKNG